MAPRRKARFGEVTLCLLLGSLAWAVALCSEEWYAKQWRVEHVLLPAQRFDVLLTAGLYGFELDAGRLVSALRPRQHQGLGTVTRVEHGAATVALDEDVEGLAGGGGDLEDLVSAPRLEVGRQLSPAGTALLDVVNDLQGASRTYAALGELCPRGVHAMRDALLERPTGPGAGKVDLGPAMKLAFAVQDEAYSFCDGLQAGTDALWFFSLLTVPLLGWAFVCSQELAVGKPGAWKRSVIALALATCCMAGVCFSFTHGLRMQGLNATIAHAQRAQRAVAESFHGQVTEHGYMEPSPGATAKLVWDGPGQSFYWAVVGCFLVVVALVRVATTAAPKPRDKVDADLEELRNDEGAPVRLSYATGGPPLYYCGRMVGADVIGHPLSDGHCGPDDGPQCPSCVRFQRQH